MASAQGISQGQVNFFIGSYLWYESEKDRTNDMGLRPQDSKWSLQGRQWTSANCH
jgi:hypothetical protein